MNKTVALTLKIVVGVILCTGILCGVYFWTSFKSEANEVADIVSKGNAYMNAECYHDAIMSYEEALAYEPDNEKLKNALVKAYVLYASTLGETDDAIYAYQSAINYEPSNKLPFWAVANIYENRGDEDAMMDVLRKGYENTGDEDMQTKVSNIEIERERLKAEEEAAAKEEQERLALEAQRESLLKPVADLFAAKDYDGVKDLIRTDEYLSFADEVIGDASFYCGERDENGKRNGTGIAIYENGYYYYGQFVNDIRSGHGVWMRAVYANASAIGSYIFEGEWSNDLPNGDGTATSNFYKDKISADGFVKQVITGKYVNGLEEGSMNLAGTVKTGKTLKYQYKCTEGVAAKSSKEDSTVKGQYIIAKSADETTNLTSDGSKRGVEGFIE